MISAEKKSKVSTIIIISCLETFMSCRALCDGVAGTDDIDPVRDKEETNTNAHPLHDTVYYTCNYQIFLFLFPSMQKQDASSCCFVVSESNMQHML